MRVAFSLALPFYMGRRRSNSRRRGLRSQGEGENGANGKSGKEEKAHRPSSSSYVPFPVPKKKRIALRRLEAGCETLLLSLLCLEEAFFRGFGAKRPVLSLLLTSRRGRSPFFLHSALEALWNRRERGLSTEAEAVFFFPLDWRYDPEAKEKTGLAVARQGPFLLLLLFHHNSCGGLGLVFVLGTSLLWQVLIRRRRRKNQEGERGWEADQEANL